MGKISRIVYVISGIISVLVLSYLSSNQSSFIQLLFVGGCTIAIIIIELIIHTIWKNRKPEVYEASKEDLDKWAEKSLTILDNEGYLDKYKKKDTDRKPYFWYIFSLLVVVLIFLWLFQFNVLIKDGYFKNSLSCPQANLSCPNIQIPECPICESPIVNCGNPQINTSVNLIFQNKS